MAPLAAAGGARAGPAWAIASPTLHGLWVLCECLVPLCCPLIVLDEGEPLVLPDLRTGTARSHGSQRTHPLS